MFKGSKNVRPDQHPSWITSIGGEANAETDEDSTIYWQTVPLTSPAAGACGSRPTGWRRSR